MKKAIKSTSETNPRIKYASYKRQRPALILDKLQKVCKFFQSSYFRNTG